MADINIYGRLWNQTTDGEIVSAAQVKDADYSGGSMFQHAINEALLKKVNSIESAASGITWDTLDVPDIVTTLVLDGDYVSDVGVDGNNLNVNYGVSGSTTVNVKTINGSSIFGSGDITIDLTLYKVVTSLPTSSIDSNKIYLVVSGTQGTNNKYTEYIYVNSAWEKIGEYTASVDLSAYMKTATANSTFVKNLSVSGKTITVTKGDGSTSTITTQDTTYSAATSSAAGLMSASDKSKLDAIAAGATKVTVDSALSSTSTNPVQNKVINTALASKQATLTAGTNITISGTTISAKDTTYNVATQTTDGLMSSEDKTMLDDVLNDDAQQLLGSLIGLIDAAGDGLTDDDVQNYFDNLANDTKVTQAAAGTTSGSFNLLLGGSATTAAETGTVTKANQLTYIPSTRTLDGANAVFSGSLEANTIVKTDGAADEILMADGSVGRSITTAEIDAICV